MIKLKVKADTLYNRSYNLRRFDCPKCGSRDTFTGHTISPAHCWQCKTKYPQISNMMKFQIDRIEYYMDTC